MYKITLVKSLSGRKPNQVATAKALGLKKIGQTVKKEENDAIRYDCYHSSYGKSCTRIKGGT